MILVKLELKEATERVKERDRGFPMKIFSGFYQKLSSELGEQDFGEIGEYDFGEFRDFNFGEIGDSSGEGPHKEREIGGYFR